MINTTTISQDLCHASACAREAYDNGSMDGFLTASNSTLSMGYFNPSLIPYYWDYASQFVLLDNFFSSVLGPSLPNHLYLVAGQSGGLVGDTTYGAINFTSSTVYNNAFHFTTVVDELDAKNISWKYYAGGYQSLNDWNPLPAFPQIYTNQTLLGRIAPADQFLTDIANHSLPSVSWIMPASDEASEHPPYNITTGELDVVSTIYAVMSSEYWNSTAIFVTWDDYGGWYDHVTPPQVDQYGYGFRVPCLIISPYAKQGFIDNTQGDFTSILKFVETVFSLQPLPARDASANSLMEAFDFSQAPRQSLVLPGPYLPDHYPLTLASTTLSGNASTSSISATTSIASNTSGVPSSNPTDLIAVTLLAVPAIACLALLLWPRRSRRSRGGEPPDR